MSLSRYAPFVDALLDIGLMAGLVLAGVEAAPAVGAVLLAEGVMQGVNWLRTPSPNEEPSDEGDEEEPVPPSSLQNQDVVPKETKGGNSEEEKKAPVQNVTPPIGNVNQVGNNDQVLQTPKPVLQVNEEKKQEPINWKKRLEEAHKRFLIAFTQLHDDIAANITGYTLPQPVKGKTKPSEIQKSKASELKALYLLKRKEYIGDYENLLKKMVPLSEDDEKILSVFQENYRKYLAKNGPTYITSFRAALDELRDTPNTANTRLTRRYVMDRRNPPNYHGYDQVMGWFMDEVDAQRVDVRNYVLEWTAVRCPFNHTAGASTTKVYLDQFNPVTGENDMLLGSVMRGYFKWTSAVSATEEVITVRPFSVQQDH